MSTTFIQINRKSMRIEISENEARERNRRVRNAIMAEDSRLKAMEADRNARGYCPDCHLLCTKDHRCMRCGKIITPEDIAAQAERRKKILELNQSKKSEKPANVFYTPSKKPVEHVSSRGDQRPFYLKVYI